MLGGVPVVLLVEVLGVSPLLLLLLDLHPAGGHGGREAGRQRLEARQLHQGAQALGGRGLVHQEVYSWRGEGGRRKRREGERGEEREGNDCVNIFFDYSFTYFSK